jgi:hypothetical protein
MDARELGLKLAWPEKVMPATERWATGGWLAPGCSLAPDALTMRRAVAKNQSTESSCSSKIQTRETKLIKKIASTIALMSLGGLAHAQSSVQIYGIMDTAVETMNNVGANKSSLTRMPNLTGSVPSRLGFRGREDLGAA